MRRKPLFDNGVFGDREMPLRPHGPDLYEVSHFRTQGWLPPVRKTPVCDAAASPPRVAHARHPVTP